MKSDSEAAVDFCNEWLAFPDKQKLMQGYSLEGDFLKRVRILLRDHKRMTEACMKARAYLEDVNVSYCPGDGFGGPCNPPCRKHRMIAELTEALHPAEEERK